MRKWVFEDITPGLENIKNWKDTYNDQKKKSKQKGISMLQGKWSAGSCNILPNPAGGIKMFNHMTGADTYSDAGEASSDGSSSISGDAGVSGGTVGGESFNRHKNRSIMFEDSYNEEIEKQEDVIYKGITIEHFPLSWKYGNDEFNSDGWIIKSPYYIQSSASKPKTFMPLYPENEDGEVINFETLDDAKSYIDKYIETKLGHLKIKHGNECHYVLDSTIEESIKMPRRFRLVENFEEIENVQS